MAARRPDDEARSRAVIDGHTGETYYRHARESASGAPRGATGYVDPFDEFGQRAFEYRPEEIEGFDRVAERVAREQAARPGYFRPPRERLTVAGPKIASGPFALFTRKLERMLRAHNAVREIVATLGPAPAGDRESPREILKARGAFFLRLEGSSEHYAMMEDPPNPKKPIEEESFEIDAASLEALIQERLRFSVTLGPSREYKFYFASRQS